MRKKKAIKNVFFSILHQLIAIVCGFIVPRLIIKTYGSDTNGLISSITQFLAYITLLEAGIGPVLKSQLYKPLAEKNNTEIENILYSAEKYFKRIASIFLIYIVVLLLFYPYIVNRNFSRSFSSLLIIIISISSFAEYYFGMTYRLFLQSDQKSFIVSIIQSSTTTLNTIIIIVLALNNVNILLVKLLSSLIFTLRPLCQWLYVRKKYNFNFKKVDKNYRLKNQWDGLAQHIAAIIYGNTDIAVLTFFTSVIHVSIYSVYNLVTSSLQKINQSISDGIEASFGDIMAKNEKVKLRDSFNKYEVLYYTIITIMYTCALSLIIPFVKAYTFGIKDANYVVPIFGVIIILSSLVYAIKIPYHSLVKTAGHFRQTQIGAWVEAICNLSLSIILVFKYGLIGVAIGTLVSTIIRTIELLIYVCNNLLEEKIIKSMKKIVLTIVEIVIFSIIINHFISPINMNSMKMYIIYGAIVFIASSICIGIINLVIYRKTMMEIFNIYIIKLKKRRNN